MSVPQFYTKKTQKPLAEGQIAVLAPLKATVASTLVLLPATGERQQHGCFDSV